MTQHDMPELSGILSGLLKNPEALAALSSILGQAPHFPPKSEDCREPPPPPRPHHKDRGNERKNLLLALKPFLSPERRRAVDLIIILQDTMETFRKDRDKKGEHYVCPSIPSTH